MRITIDDKTKLEDYEISLYCHCHSLCVFKIIQFFLRNIDRWCTHAHVPQTSDFWHFYDLMSCLRGTSSNYQTLRIMGLTPAISAEEAKMAHTAISHTTFTFYEALCINGSVQEQQIHVPESHIMKPHPVSPHTAVKPGMTTIFTFRPLRRFPHTTVQWSLTPVALALVHLQDSEVMCLDCLEQVACNETLTVNKLPEVSSWEKCRSCTLRDHIMYKRTTCFSSLHLIMDLYNNVHTSWERHGTFPMMQEARRALIYVHEL